MERSPYRMCLVSGMRRCKSTWELCLLMMVGVSQATHLVPGLAHPRARELLCGLGRRPRGIGGRPAYRFLTAAACERSIRPNAVRRE